MDGSAFLQDALSELRKLELLAHGALEQVADADLTRSPGPDENSIAITLKHLAGNMRSRWTDFLTSDGEKPDRDRDGEFELGPRDTPPKLRAELEAGWRLVREAIGALEPDDLTRTVTIRGEPHSVPQAVLRQLTHYAYHVGQVVQLARRWKGTEWRSLSIPRGASEGWEVGRDGAPYAAGERGPG